MNIEYHQAHDTYTKFFSRGETSLTQTEFDNRYVLSCRKITRRLIEAEEAYKDAKSHALAIRAIESTFGEHQYGSWMDEWSPQSEPVEEHRARQALRNWTFVKNWVVEIPNLDDEAVPDPMEVDEWDAESVDMGESNSLAAEVEWYREKIDFWRETCAQLRQQMRGQEDAKMQ